MRFRGRRRRAVNGSVEGRLRRGTTALMALVLACGALGAGAARATTTSLRPDATFAAALGSGFNSGVYSVAEDGDGGYLVAGTFTTFQGVRIAGTNVPGGGLVRLDADLNLDTAFDAGLGAGFNNYVFSVARMADGGYLIGGQFSTYQGIPVGPLVRLDADLNLDTAFTTNLGAGSFVYSAAPTPDGGYLVGGQFTTYQGTPVGRLVLLDPDLALDTTFNASLGTGFNSIVYSAVPTQDGGYLVGGDFTTYRGDPVGRFVRLDADLNPVAGSGTGFDGTVLSVTETDGGSHLVGGSFTTYQDEPAARLARLDADLTRDTGFQADLGTGITGTVSAVAQVDGGYLVGGSFTAYQGVPAPRLVRLLLVSVTVDALADPAPGSAGSPVDPVTVSATVDPASAAVAFAATGLPPGLSIDPATGVVSGTPTTTGSFAVTVSATASGVTDTTSFAWEIRDAPVAPTISGDPVAGTAGTGYTFAFEIAGDPTPPVILLDGDLPTGLELSSAGVLSGTPTQAGVFDLSLRADNGTGTPAIHRTSLVIAPGPVDSGASRIVSSVPEGGTVLADGARPAGLVVSVVDAFGNPVPDQHVVVTSDRDAALVVIEPVVDEDDGTYTVVARSTVTGPVTFGFTVDGAQGGNTAVVEFTVPPVTPGGAGTGTTSAGPDGAGHLAVTGAGATAAITAALLALVVGGGLLLAARRSRRV